MVHEDKKAHLKVGGQAPLVPRGAVVTKRDEMIAAVRAGMNDVVAGRTIPARSALKSLAKKYGIPRSDA